MPVTNATILIPDISGFTQFMSTTELEHGSHLMSEFLETIIQNVDENFEISEIEGDAVLLYRKGTIPTKQEILDLCLKMFHAFHQKRKLIQHVAICPCGACQSLVNLSLKFITHYGSLLEIKINRFTKASGLDMIIAHRILKNSVPSNEYILITENFLQQINNDPETHGLSWQSAADEFPFIGKVNYKFALLEDVKNKIPDPEIPETHYETDNRPYHEVEIEAPPKDVFLLSFLDMPKRIFWMKGLKAVEQETDHAYVGSVHAFLYEGIRVVVSPIRMSLEGNEIFYAEKASTHTTEDSVIYEYRFISLPDGGCKLACRIVPVADNRLSVVLYSFLYENLKISLAKLKEFSENGFQHAKKVEPV